MPIKLGDRGPAVGHIQQDLIETGHAIPADELAVTTFGPGTDAAVRAFQNEHRLAVDGIVGPLTAAVLAAPNSGSKFDRPITPGWRCEPSQVRPEVRRVLEIATGEIGVKEAPDGSNRGPRIDLYTDPDFGIPWCMAFVSWCFQRGCDEGSPFGRILSAWRMSEWAEKSKRVIGEAATPQAGDVFVILRAQFHGHAGIVVGLSDDGRLCTVEGNSGNAVRGLVREKSSVTMLVRPVPLI